jgi:hypothetical protein
MRHNRRQVKLTHVVAVVSFGLDAVASSNNEKSELGNLQHHVLLVVFVEAHVTLLAE